MVSRVMDRKQLNQLDSMWKAPGLIPTLIAVMAAFGGWSLLMPVIPQAILDDGRGTSLAGAYTGVFMAATVLTQTQTPRMCRRLGYGLTMLISGLFLGLPTILHVFGTSAGLVLGIAVLRGMGFGALTVAESALIAELVPVKFLGKASGALGVAVGLSELLFLPLGLIIADELGSYAPVYILGAAISVIGSVMALFIPKIKPAPKQGKGGKENVGEPVPGSAASQPSPVAHVATWKLVAIPAVAICTIAMGFGGVSAFLAPAAGEVDPVSGAVVAGLSLSVLGGAQMVFRYFAGIYADRRSRAGDLIVPAMVSGFFGLAMMSAVVFFGFSAWLLLAAAAFYGAGFGMAQNEALLLMFARLPRERTAEASAFWNMAFDSGTGIGSFVLGAVAAAALKPYPAVFAFAAALVAVGLIGAVLDQVVGKHRVSEYHNTRATLRKLGGAVRRRTPEAAVRAARPAKNAVTRLASKEKRAQARQVRQEKRQ
ncbi:MFS transporter [Corynebacterium lactis]|uniref:MFS transporter permease n=1 Tax=Corynebacterium lactis RW2-5 TaxID=1408189 RepID=A0A0K2H0N1_9CORY|nr:MFS transporter [Corynebacterium lactis]ALA67594.1 MFS transporter permease [Corynebacterium lactis RW2-5]